MISRSPTRPIRPARSGSTIQQYFDGVLRAVWDFHIGGYQPARKWLKDRKGRELDFNDIRHYQRIIKSLALTLDIMDAIDGVEFLPEG